MTAPSRSALHEAAHAVIARWLGLGLKRVWILGSEPSGKVDVCWPVEADPENELQVLVAANVCLSAFGIDTSQDQGDWDDEAKISAILDGKFPDDLDDDNPVRIECRASVERKVEGLFKQPNVRAAA
jgi:hypothetical protein